MGAVSSAMAKSVIEKGAAIFTNQVITKFREKFSSNHTNSKIDLTDFLFLLFNLGSKRNHGWR